MRSMRRAAEMGREGGVVANVSGLVRSAPPCSTIDPEGEVGLNDDLDEDSFRWTCVMGIIALVVTLLIGDLLERRHVYRIPEAAVGLAVGGVCAAIATLTDNAEMLHDQAFDDQFFMVWLLPPIIFAAGFNMNIPAFFANLFPTLFLAFVGTSLSAAAVAVLLYSAGWLGLCYPLTKLAALFFGSLISATDPVTVLAVFKAIGVRDDIFAIVFGESVLNDAVAIVLARTVLAFNLEGDGEGDSTSARIGGAMVTFIVIFVGSMLIGVLAGMLCALTFKRVRLCDQEEKQVVEAVLAFGFPWVSYYGSEAMQLSGIVSILFCGTTMATYVRPSLSHAGLGLTRDLFEALAKGAETFVFVYLGMAAVTFPILHNTVWALAAATLFACLVGRLHVFLGAAVTNCLRHASRNRARGAARTISLKQSFCIWFSGLRGGVAFAIAAASYGDLDFPTRCGGWKPSNSDEPWPRWCSEGMNDSLAILQTTMLIAIFTILAFGSTARDVAIFSRVLQPKRAPAAAGIAGIQGTLPSPKTGRWKSLDAWLTPRLTIVPVAESDSDSGHNGDSHKHGGHSNNHSRIHNHSPSHATSTDTRRGAVGLSGHRPAMGGLLAVSEGVWNTEPVGPSARELGEISLDDPPGVEMVATRWPPSSPPSPPSPRSTGPGHPGYAAPLLE